MTKAKTEQVIPQACEWFLKCHNEATQLAPHPILGNVPVCDRCAEFAAGPQDQDPLS